MCEIHTFEDLSTFDNLSSFGDTSTLEGVYDHVINSSEFSIVDIGANYRDDTSVFWGQHSIKAQQVEELPSMDLEKVTAGIPLPLSPLSSSSGTVSTRNPSKSSLKVIEKLSANKYKKNKKQKLLKVTVKDDIFQALSVIPKSDVRRTYTSVIIESFNSCDMRLLMSNYKSYCSKDLVTITKYLGSVEYLGADSVFTGNSLWLLITFRNQLTYINAYVGIDDNAALWGMLFVSAPDFLFTILSTKVEPVMDSSSPISCIISSTFTFSCTRVCDVEVERYSETRYNIQCSEPEDESDAVADDSSVVSAVSSNLSLFQRTEDCSIPAELDTSDMTSVVSIESKGVMNNINGSVKFKKGATLSKVKDIRCVGTFHIHVDRNNKIRKYEFVYCGTEERINSDAL